MKDMHSIEILGVNITANSSDDILEYVFSVLNSSSEKVTIFTPNPEMIVAAQKNPIFKNILNQAQINLPDGVGVSFAAQLLHNQVLPRISGVDFLQSLCKESVRKAVNTGFLGAKEGVALAAAKCLQEMYPGLAVSFVGSEWESGVWIPKEYQKDIALYEKQGHEEKKSLTPRVQLPASKQIDILFVAYGHEKQEKWIAENREKLPFRVGMGVGGAFDYLSGSINRAPKPIRDIGMEWFYRLIRQPWRAKRQVALLTFLKLVFAKRFSSASSA